jgi:hypothetical protein
MHAAVRYTSLAVAALVAASVSAAAQSNGSRSTTQGLMLDLHLNGSSMKVEDGTNESGGGMGVRMGWGFTPRLTAFVGYDRASIESADAQLADKYSLGQVDLGLQYNFANSDRAWRPFVEAAATRRSMYADVTLDDGSTADMSASGLGMSIGGGFQYFFSAPWAISTGLNYTFGSFTKGEMDGVSADLDPAISARGARLNVGLSWHPMARR